LEGGINLFAYVWNNPLNQIDPFGLEAWIKCLRCGESGAMSCRIIEDGIETDFIITNFGKNSSPDQPLDPLPPDPYGTNGPLPPGAYDMSNAYSPKFQRILPSPTNVGIPGTVVTPMGTRRRGIRYHMGSYSEGCATVGEGTPGALIEDQIRHLIDRHRGHGGTSMTIEEDPCC
jgi:hypothetical protein